jgi:Krev interaction trapped protein 1
MIKAGLNDAAMTLLYEEARHNYLRGLYPCSDEDTIALAGIMMYILHGSYDAKKDKAHLAK